MMKDMKNILLIDIPDSLMKSLQEQIDTLDGFKLFTNSSANIFKTIIPDLIISSNKKIDIFSQTPKMEINNNKKYRLGNILLEVIRILKEPNLYLKNITLGEYILEPKEKLLLKDENRLIKLTDKEIDILIYLSRHKDKEISRNELLENVWHYQEAIDTHTVETHIYRLRKKIEKKFNDAEFLRTKENGYSLNIY